MKSRRENFPSSEGDMNDAVKLPFREKQRIEEDLRGDGCSQLLRWLSAMANGTPTSL